MQPEQLGPYRIVKQLGKGGMGTVYEGRHVDTGRRTAIKVLNPQLAALHLIVKFGNARFCEIAGFLAAGTENTEQQERQESLHAMQYAASVRQ